MIPHLKKFWATYGALVAAGFYFLEPSFQAAVAAHPNTAVGVLLGAAIATFHSTAPKDAAAAAAAKKDADGQ